MHERWWILEHLYGQGLSSFVRTMTRGISVEVLLEGGGTAYLEVVIAVAAAAACSFEEVSLSSSDQSPLMCMK